MEDRFAADMRKRGAEMAATMTGQYLAVLLREMATECAPLQHALLLEAAVRVEGTGATALSGLSAYQPMIS